MEANQFLLEIFTFVQAIFSVILGVIVVQLFAFLLLARSIEHSEKPRELARAIFSYFMLAIGALLMSLSAIPTLIAALGQGGFSTQVYVSLVLVFVAGGILFLWHDYQARLLSEEVRHIPSLIYHYTIKTTGQLSLVLAVMYFTLTISLQSTDTSGWWSMPVAIFLYGLFLCWITGEKPTGKTSTARVSSTPLHTRTAHRQKGRRKK